MCKVYLSDLPNDVGDDEVHLVLLDFADGGVGREHRNPDLDLLGQLGVLLCGLVGVLVVGALLGLLGSGLAGSVAPVGLGSLGGVADGDVAVLYGGDGDLVVGVGGDESVGEQLAVVGGQRVGERVHVRRFGEDGGSKSRKLEHVRVFEELQAADPICIGELPLLLAQDLHEPVGDRKMAKWGLGLWGAEKKCFNCLRAAGLKMNAKKCSFGQEEVKYLGFTL